MKRILVAICMILIQCSLCAQKVSLFDELDPIYPDTEISKEIDHVILHAPKGGILSVNILFNELEKRDIISIKHNLEGLFNKTKISRLLDVPVEENTGLDQTHGKLF
jgi:glutamate formiminotransferase